MKKTTAAIFVTIFIMAQNSRLDSFEVGTHIELSQQATLSSTLDDFLKIRLNFPGGVRDRVAGREIRDVIADGSDREDDDLRFCNHFHNPLRTWDQAGLTLGVPVVCGASNESSVIWGQNPAQGFSWQFARDEYFKGLTEATQSQREKHLANTFRALGQLIHLVQDSALSQHTRNDPHPFVKGLEGYVENVRAQGALGDPAAQTLFNSWINTSVKFAPPLETLTIPPNPLAPIPIARLIDTEKYRQSGIPSAGTDIGIAEYSNANFLSEDTIFKDFTFPRTESLGAAFDGIEPVTGKPRRYFPKVADGETVNRFVAEGVWWETLLSFLSGDQGYILDRGVYEDYADKLLPRAVGYSAGMLDYFFRGFIDGAGQGTDLFPVDNPPTTLGVNLVNGTPDEDTGSGTLVLVLTYADQFDTIETFPPVLVSNPVSVGVTRSPQTVTFSFTSLPFPATFGSDSSYNATLVYKGPLGFENGAVIASNVCGGFQFIHGRFIEGPEAVWVVGNCLN